MQFVVDLPEELLRRARAEARRQGITVPDFHAQALETYLSGTDRERAAGRPAHPGGGTGREQAEAGRSVQRRGWRHTRLV